MRYRRLLRMIFFMEFVKINITAAFHIKSTYKIVAVESGKCYDVICNLMNIIADNSIMISKQYILVYC